MKNYFKIFIINTFILILLRLIETFLVFIDFGSQKFLIPSEGLGLLYDISIISIFLLLLFPLFNFLQKRNINLANNTFLILIGLFSVLHLSILMYFIYQLEVLDIFLFHYSIEEILFTVNTSDSNYFPLIISMILIVLTLYLLNRYMGNLSEKLFKYFKPIISSVVVIFIIFQWFGIQNINKFSTNKSLYFYTKSIEYYFKTDYTGEDYTSDNGNEFQKLDTEKLYINFDYPLLHKLDTIDFLGKQFEKFDQKPNIVILIVEGLSDDFLHKYHGVELMPNLKKLAEKSLYWNKCFTLGERSFAVVPSILGSLPYGRKGFTLLDKYPKHISLVSILDANEYYTSFFYGQGAWFHNKDRFFKYNNIDLIFDNSKFSDKYEKIIVGENKFFWGYHDKDLFSQSIEVLDTISNNKALLNIYFTGTSHSPFIISNQQYYDQQFDSLSNQLKNKESVDFFNIYKKYIQSILFVDDAIQEFLVEYQKRTDYENTIFLITGDHPMTEIPVQNSLKKYHVPLIIYGEKLKNSVEYNIPVSHLDIYESLLAFLNPYLKTMPDISSALGSKLTFNTSEDKRYFAFMNGVRQVVDFYSDGYYLSREQLFKVDDKLGLETSYNMAIKKKLKKQLLIFNQANTYVSLQDKILTDSVMCESLSHYNILSLSDSTNIKFSNEYHSLISTMEMPNSDIFYEIQFEFSGKQKGATLVYQLLDQNDSTLLWKNMGLPNKAQYFQAHIQIPKQAIPDSIIKFKSYLWNTQKNEIEYSDLKLLIHADMEDDSKQ